MKRPLVRREPGSGCAAIGGIGRFEVRIEPRTRRIRVPGPTCWPTPSALRALGEVAMVGAAAAIVNAIFHATGRRLREMPIRVEHLLWRPADRGAAVGGARAVAQRSG